MTLGKKVSSRWVVLYVNNLAMEANVRRVLLVVAVTLVCCAVIGTAQASAAQRPLDSPSSGYWLMTGYGTSYAFNAPYLGSPEAYGSDQCVNSAVPANPPYDCVGLSSAPDGKGYWIGAGTTAPAGCTGTPACVGVFGSVSAFGVGVPTGVGPSVIYGLAAPLVGVSAAPVGAWLVGSDGGVFAMAGAPFFGSMGGQHLNEPIVGMAATPDGKGYWEVASDGGVFAFGDAAFYGSMGDKTLNKPIVGMAATPDGKGYWEVASDGGVFAFGDATFAGSAVGQTLDSPIVGITASVPGSHPIPNPSPPD
jgi:hypothetical protein